MIALLVNMMIHMVILCERWTDIKTTKSIFYIGQYYSKVLSCDIETQDKPFFIYSHGLFTESIIDDDETEYHAYCNETYGDLFLNWKNCKHMVLIHNLVIFSNHIFLFAFVIHPADDEQPMVLDRFNLHWRLSRMDSKLFNILHVFLTWVMITFRYFKIQFNHY